IDDGYILELVAQVEHIPDGAAHRRQADAAGDEDHRVALHLLDRKMVAVRPAKSHRVSHAQAAQRLRHLAGGLEAALDVALARGRGCNAECALAFAEGGVLAKLSGGKLELPGHLWGFKFELQRA